MVIKLVLATVLLMLVSCSCATTPRRAYDAQPILPEDWWERVYDVVAACADEHGWLKRDKSFDRIEWLVTPPGGMKDPHDYSRAWLGLFSPERRIYLDAWQVMNTSVIAHEILHYVTEVTHAQVDLWAALESACVYGSP